MSVAWQYYHARKRSEETPLDYLYRLNVAALRAKLKIKAGNAKARREHVDHYVKTLGDPELADRLTLLRLADVDELEEVLRARDVPRVDNVDLRSGRNSDRRSRPVLRQRQPGPRYARSKRMILVPNGVSGSDGSDSEGDLQRLAAAEEKLISFGGASRDPDPAPSRTKASEGAQISD
ncbi:LOW QUALITY PROTEIN: hypothetical protein PHMEG_00035002 [Phytophthora megakarya]|uniref:Uncharacterized protein n=1 Tax=Phytophthora megakarya TaxID=4795 RepID=A0A225UQ70_9STRA|nr:LOW QUALITY PROTEIN: hypothetical protein PHMEG_00035002 [Phytophthora megakarya]